MYFSNRRDYDQILDAFDQTSCSNLSFSKDGFSTTIDLEIQRVIPEYRYLTVDDRLYYITDYKLSDNTTTITAIDFISKWSDTINLNPGTWTLENVLKKINGYAEVRFMNVANAQVTTTEPTKASDVISQIENNLDGTILYETLLDVRAKTTNSAYYPSAIVVKFDDQTLGNADVLVASDEFDVETDYNPQLDLAYTLTLNVQSINDIAKLRTYKNALSAADYQKLVDYVGKSDNSSEDNVIDDDEASQIILKALSFSKKNFIKNVGNVNIMHHQNIVAVEGDAYALAKSYKYDYLHHLITDIRVERQ